MPTYKLIYFNGRGRAELCRLLFALAGQDFEDVRLDKPGWAEIKPITLAGQLPVMEIDGKQFCQSHALENFLAREFGYYGQTNLEALQIEEISGIIEDLRLLGIKVLFAEPADKEAIAKEFTETKSPHLLKALETRLNESNSSYFVGSSVTLADIAFYDIVSFMDKHLPGLLDNYPGLKAHEEMISNLEKIKDYVAKREPTPF